MILTEDQSIQLACILIEASEDKGSSEGILSKVKSVIKRVLDWIKEKGKKLVSFIKEKVSKVTSFLFKPIDKLLSNSRFVEEFKRSYKEKYLPSLKKGNPIKDYFDELQAAQSEVSSLGKTIEDLSFRLKNQEAEAELEKLDSALNKMDELMEKFEDMSKKVVDAFRYEELKSAHASMELLKKARIFSKAFVNQETELTDMIRKRERHLSNIYNEMEKATNANQYSYKSNAAYALGKITSFQVDFVMRAFNKVISIIKFLASPILNFYKKLKDKKGKQPSEGSSGNLPAVM